MKLYHKAGVVVRRSGDDGDEILLVSARRHAGSWVFPAGTVEEGEAAAQAAARECEEESGYTVRTGEEIGAVTVTGEGWTKEFVFFSAAVTGEVERKESDRERKWVRVSRLEDEVADVFAPISKLVKK
ncbi:MAG: NUDIX domain-containing protein [Thermodesulfobacteriota bacterium]